MNIVKGMQAELLIAKRYGERGYAVTLNPPSSAFPFSLGGYQPDILATRDGERLVVSVRTADVEIDAELVKRAANRVEEHEGWRFLVVTLPEPDMEEKSLLAACGMTAQSIETHLRYIDRLAGNTEIAGLVLPLLWTAYVSALQILLVKENVDINPRTDLNLLNQAYYLGILSFQEYEAARYLLELRDRAVRSLDILGTPDNVRDLRQMIGAILAQLERLPAEQAQA